MFSISTNDLVIIILSPLVVVAIGLLASRKQEKTAKGFFLASGKMSWYVIGAAFVSTSVSSEQMVGTNGAAYEYGMAIANWEWLGLSYLPLIIFFIPVYLHNKIVTVPQFLQGRFGPHCANIYSWIMLLAYIFIFMVPTLYGGSLAFSKLTGWNFHLILWCTVIFIGIYTTKGGLGSVMWADAYQCLLLMIGGVVLFVIALTKIPGGWGAMQSAAPERFHLYQPANDPIAPFAGLLIANLLGASLFYQAANQVMVQRILAARTYWDGVMGIIFAGLINRIRPLVTCFLGLVVWHWVNRMHMAEPLSNRDDTFAFALINFAPDWGIRGLIIAGFLAAVMSTISALANSTATIFSMDFYKKVLRPDAQDKELVTAGRIASMIALAIAAIMAPMVARFGGIFIYFQKCVTFLAIPFITVMLFGIFSRRINYPAAVFGMSGGLLISLAIGFGAPVLGLKLHWIYLGLISQVIIAAAVIAISMMTAAPNQNIIEPFIWRPAYLQYLKGNEAMPWYKSLVLWLVVLYGTTAAIYIYFW